MHICHVRAPCPDARAGDARGDRDLQYDLTETRSRDARPLRETETEREVPGFVYKKRCDIPLSTLKETTNNFPSRSPLT